MTLLTDVEANETTARLLNRLGIVPPHIVQVLLSRAVKRQVWLGELAVEEGLVTERELAQWLADACNQESIPFASLSVDPRTIALVEQQFCERYLMVPLSIHDGTLGVAVANPYDSVALTELAERTGLTIAPRITTISVVRKLISQRLESCPAMSELPDIQASSAMPASPVMPGRPAMPGMPAIEKK